MTLIRLIGGRILLSLLTLLIVSALIFWILEVLPGLGPPRYEPVKAIAFHTSSTSKFYGDGYAVESP